jgi:hypothetical protein
MLSNFYQCWRPISPSESLDAVSFVYNQKDPKPGAKLDDRSTIRSSDRVTRN